MSGEIERLRAQAKRARQLLKGTTDPLTRLQLSEYILECEGNADLLEARQKKLN